MELTDTLGLNISSTEPATPIFFNDIEMPVLPYDGKYFTGRKLVLSVPEFTDARRFEHWAITEDGSTRYVDSLSVTLPMNVATIAQAVYTDSSDPVRRAGLYINEVSANNEIFVDEEFKYEDWIEIYNSSDYAISMDDYYITNDENNLGLFQFSIGADTIPAHGYGIVWCSAKTNRGAMHTDFKLEKDGGKIILAKQTQDGIAVVDSMTYYKHTKRTSFGRCPDGSANLVLFDKATFKQRNLSSSYNELVYVQESQMVTKLKAAVYIDNTQINVSRTGDNLLINKVDNRNNNVEASLISVTGARLQQVRFSGSSYIMNLAGLPTGVYLLYLQYDNQKQIIKIIR
ncbi:MAG: lamin tail domain-containing protein [Paludibacter sp.]|nr:lamin tail domain-containing protein [Paludibacter sp.]